ncbi:hypothetical protein MNBD_GAMMA01-700 [hydrothermal vent metagenome]|uniref:Lipoprotein n=1 Tax=hydrothermal vent metagenome TaxID=652676 RepID=A0A3B0VVI5_9ZZZZ
MKKIILTFTVVFIITSCASKVTKNPVVTYERDSSLEYQNTICTLIGNGPNFNKEYITFAYDGNYEKASIEKLTKKHGKRWMKDYPAEYSSFDFLLGYFNLMKNCEKSKQFIVIDDVELIHNLIHLGKMGSSKLEFYLIIKININGNIEKSYTALSKTPKYNAFTPNKKFENYRLEAKKSAFKKIFQQIDADLKQLDTNNR